ncbi:Conserved_hypothetical protein [Hexamita inflata]|uniref:Uncharacterized protein n=1 Tax=Hexamita inflata TaxID=28002 RepID=A0AA86RJF2_9EUKA|nr:Conserved hypothetical protein [Hexamita inflata]
MKKAVEPKTKSVAQHGSQYIHQNSVLSKTNVFQQDRAKSAHVKSNQLQTLNKEFDHYYNTQVKVSEGINEILRAQSSKFDWKDKIPSKQTSKSIRRTKDLSTTAAYLTTQYLRAASTASITKTPTIQVPTRKLETASFINQKESLEKSRSKALLNDEATQLQEQAVRSCQQIAFDLQKMEKLTTRENIKLSAAETKETLNRIQSLKFLHKQRKEQQLKSQLDFHLKYSLEHQDKIDKIYASAGNAQPATIVNPNATCALDRDWIVSRTAPRSQSNAFFVTNRMSIPRAQSAKKQRIYINKQRPGSFLDNQLNFQSQMKLIDLIESSDINNSTKQLPSRSPICKSGFKALELQRDKFGRRLLTDLMHKEPVQTIRHLNPQEACEQYIKALNTNQKPPELEFELMMKSITEQGVDVIIKQEQQQTQELMNEYNHEPLPQETKLQFLDRAIKLGHPEIVNLIEQTQTLEEIEMERTARQQLEATRLMTKTPDAEKALKRMIKTVKETEFKEDRWQALATYNALADNNTEKYRKEILTMLTEKQKQLYFEPPKEHFQVILGDMLGQFEKQLDAQSIRNLQSEPVKRSVGVDRSGRKIIVKEKMEQINIWLPHTVK